MQLTNTLRLVDKSPPFGFSPQQHFAACMHACRLSSDAHVLVGAILGFSTTVVVQVHCLDGVLWALHTLFSRVAHAIAPRAASATAPAANSSAGGSGGGGVTLNVV
jgi:hypothetical protein